jgi:predicted nucleotidyltransferase
LALRAKGVTRLAIFGPRARGDVQRSDLDVLIEVDTGSPWQMRRSLEPRFCVQLLFACARFAPAEGVC